MAENAMQKLEEEANKLLEINSRFGQNMTSNLFKASSGSGLPNLGGGKKGGKGGSLDNMKKNMKQKNAA